jgi:hypothetical protein
MGNQQILFIILGIIICATAVSGIFIIFDNHYENANRNEMKLEIFQHASQAQAWFTSPLALGGAAHNLNNIDTELITGYILNMPVNPGSTIITDKYRFVFSAVSGNPSLTITCSTANAGVPDGKYEISGTVMINAENLHSIVYKNIK